jgi:hypothetical protein
MEKCASLPITCAARGQLRITNIVGLPYFALDSNRPLGKLRVQLERRIIDQLIRIPIGLFRITQFRIL